LAEQARSAATALDGAPSLCASQLGENGFEGGGDLVEGLLHASNAEGDVFERACRAFVDSMFWAS
jgi:hypothetical protein